MSKVPLFIMLFVFCDINNISAQLLNNIYGEDRDDLLFHYGLLLGYNSMHSCINHSKSFYEKNDILSFLPDKQSSMDIGVSATCKLNNKFELRISPQVIIGADKKFNMILEDSITGIKQYKQQVLPSTILQIPLQLKLNSDRIGNFKMYLLAGVYYNYDFSWNASYRNKPELIKLKKNDYGFQIGVGSTFYLPEVIISPEIKFDAGVLNTLSRNNANNYGQYLSGIYSRMFELSIHFEN